MFNFHVKDLQVNHRYNMILGSEIFPELIIDLYFSDNAIRVNGDAHKECIAPMKNLSRINFNTSSNWLKEERYQNEDLWEREHFLDTTQRTCHI